MSEEPLEFVRQAALEMIATARSALDLLEDLVSDSRGVTEFVSHVGKLAQKVVVDAAASVLSADEPPPQQKVVEHIPIR